ncbi:hypothetical protein Pla163_32460 [Planctomycetes bacterium Pla163]|uniref:N-acetyltransferase domain-containing protein n=1 Tax=Rohdeia mirabilis TaxID=2528008 RepID=A0A518D3N9_9BACT|nr:hypothetical protein Pla163_32460 [Planctomycetes bacterium Pla163]
MASKELRLECPSCRARLTADVLTQKVVAWQPAGSATPFTREADLADDWARAARRVEERHGRGVDRFEAALSKEQERANDLDALFARSKAQREVDPDAIGARRARGFAPDSDDPAPHTDAWIERLAQAERAALAARARGLAGWEHRDPSWGFFEYGSIGLAVGPGYTEAFGLEGASDSELDAALRHAARHPEPTVRLLPVADFEQNAERLHRRGWRVAGLDAVFWRDLTLPIEATPRRSAVRRALGGDLESWRRTLIRALELAADDEQRRPERLAHEFDDPAWQLFLSSDEGQDVAAAASWIEGPVAVMAQAATQVDQRGRGHQQALIEARLRAAAEAGATTAISLPEMRGPSQSATRSQGFTLAYHQSLWVPPATD